MVKKEDNRACRYVQVRAYLQNYLKGNFFINQWMEKQEKKELDTLIQHSDRSGASVKA